MAVVNIAANISSAGAITGNSRLANTVLLASTVLVSATTSGAFDFCWQMYDLFTKQPSPGGVVLIGAIIHAGVES